MSLTFYCFYFFATYNCLVKSLFGVTYVVCSMKILFLVFLTLYVA